MLKYLAIILALASSYGWQIQRETSDSFCTYNIAPAASYQTTRNEKLTPKAKALLTHQFTYLNKGAQCFAFESADGKHVLKIFKQKRLRPALWEKLFMQMPLVKKIAIGTADFKERNRSLLSEGISVAAALCRDLTGLKLVHPYPESREIIVTIDNQKWDIAKFAFVIQVKAEPLANSKKSKTLLISRLLPLLKERARRGVFDKDRKFLNNIGFVNDKAQFIDFGEFAIDTRMCEEDYAGKYIEKQLQSLSPHFFNLYTCDKFHLEIR